MTSQRIPICFVRPGGPLRRQASCCTIQRMPASRLEWMCRTMNRAGAAAELGIRHILTNIWTPDRSFYTDQFCRLCELAARYEQTVSVEFVTWASVTDLRRVRQLLLDSGKENVGVVVDCLHFYRSRVQLHELEECPRSWFHYAHLCDCEAPIPTDEAALIHTGRAERLYPGEGAIPIAEIISRIPQVVCGVEVPHLTRVEKIGYETHARRALEGAKACLGEQR